MAALMLPPLRALFDRLQLGYAAFQDAVSQDPVGPQQRPYDQRPSATWTCAVALLLRAVIVRHEAAFFIEGRSAGAYSGLHVAYIAAAFRLHAITRVKLSAAWFPLQAVYPMPPTVRVLILQCDQDQLCYMADDLRRRLLAIMGAHVKIFHFAVSREMTRVLRSAIGRSCHRYSGLLANLFFDRVYAGLKQINEPPRIFPVAQQAGFVIALANGRLKQPPSLPVIPADHDEQIAIEGLTEDEMQPIIEHWCKLAQPMRNYIRTVGLPFFEQRRVDTMPSAASFNGEAGLRFVVAVAHRFAMFHWARPVD